MAKIVKDGNGLAFSFLLFLTNFSTFKKWPKNV